MRNSQNYNIKARKALSSAQITATATGDVIDTQGFESITFVVQTAAVTTADASNYFTAAIYEDDAVGMGTEALATAIIGTAPVVDATADANTVQQFGYNGRKRYVRLKMVETGTADAVVGAIAILGDPHNSPVV